MPELPEVETIRLQLQRFLIGHKIEDVEIRYAKKFSGDKKYLIGGKIKEIRRFGKAQAIDLDCGYSILIHIKMTGQLIYTGPNLSRYHALRAPAGFKLSKKVTGGVPGKHTHIIFHLSKGGKLYFNDVRKFGWLKVVKSNEVEKDDFIARLGPEPFKNLNFDNFKKTLSKSSRPIKIILMDQSKISGIGNIYANDALWKACINPKRPSNKLNPSEQKNLYDAIHGVLKEGIKYGGSSENTYVTPDGKEGDYQNHSLVYGKEGNKCKRCHKAKILKFFLSGRGTYFCPVCQRE